MDVHAALSHLICQDQPPGSGGLLYSTWAPVYEFMFRTDPNGATHFDDQYRRIKETVPDDKSSILEIGSGTGRLIPKLESTFDLVVAVDLHEEMVTLGEEQATTASVIHADMRTVSLEWSFDVIGMFEFVASLIPYEDDLMAFLSNVRGHLNSDGYFLCEIATSPADVIPPRPVSFEDEKFTIHRSVTEAGWVNDTTLIQREEYTIFEKETGNETTVRDETPIKLYSPSEFESQLDKIGFHNVEVLDASDGTLVVAQLE